MLPNDGISEVIAHFIGYFELSVEEMRSRLVYQEFEHEDALPAVEELPFIPVPFFQYLQLDDYIPGVEYTPHIKDIHFLPVQMAHGHGPFHISVPQMHVEDARDFLNPIQGPGSVEVEPAPLIGPQPQSIILVTSQIMELSDNDTVVFGTPNFVPEAFAPDLVRFEALIADAAEIAAPISEIEAPSAESQIPQFINAVADAIHTMAEMAPAEGVTIFTGANVEGIHVDGAIASEAPSLLEALPASLQAEVAADAPAVVQQASISITPDRIEGSVTLQSGSNLMINEVALVNAGLASTFIGVAGDYHEINLIIQTNIYSDSDTVDPGFPGAAGNVASSTIALNIASFDHETRDSAADMAAANPDAFPSNWQISTIQGDMVFMQWIVQYSLTSDADTHVLTSTGTTTTITTGENFGLNAVDFADLGRYFDLVIVGGNLYDGNIICQTNVLYDDDTLRMLYDAEGVNGAASTSGNLLWNSASILNVGATDWQTGLPDSYTQAMGALDAGDITMPESFKTDDAFQGFHGLKVLYVAGDIYDLHYVNQVNVLGDADYVAVYEQQLTGDNSTTDWNISTGSNALVNTAAIIDYDSLGDSAYIGGQIYSDAILIQANLVDTNSTPDAVSGGPLVSEVIAFLDTGDDTASHSYSDDAGGYHDSTDGPPADVMQSVLA